MSLVNNDKCRDDNFPFPLSYFVSKLLKESIPLAKGHFSLVIRIISICILMDIAALHNLEIHQMNVKIAFLNGELNSEIYMEQLERFTVPR